MSNITVMICVLCGTEYRAPVEVCDVCAKARFLRLAEGEGRADPDPANDVPES